MPHRKLLLSLLALALIATLACNNEGDTVAPEGSQIFMSGIPSTVILFDPCNDPAALLGGAQKCGTTKVVATVVSATGVPLKDQDVRFTNTAGFLFEGPIDNPRPIANLPVSTDSFGNATISLITSTSATVEARSGPAMESLTLQTIDGDLSKILLNVDSGGTSGCTDIDVQFTSCSQRLCLVARAEDTGGNGIENLLILFRVENQTGTGIFDGNFTPSQVTTNANGEAFTSFRPNNACTTECASNACDGNADVVAFTQGNFESQALQLTININ